MSQLTGTRIAYRSVAISKEEALERWRQRVKCAVDDLREAIETPLETSVLRTVRLKPGDEGYEDAHYEEVIAFHGLAIPVKPEISSS